MRKPALAERQFSSKGHLRYSNGISCIFMSLRSSFTSGTISGRATINNEEEKKSSQRKRPPTLGQTVASKLIRVHPTKFKMAVTPRQKLTLSV